MSSVVKRLALAVSLAICSLPGSIRAEDCRVSQEVFFERAIERARELSRSILGTMSPADLEPAFLRVEAWRRLTAAPSARAFIDQHPDCRRLNVPDAEEWWEAFSAGLLRLFPNIRRLSPLNTREVKVTLDFELTRDGVRYRHQEFFWFLFGLCAEGLNIDRFSYQTSSNSIRLPGTRP